MVMVHNNNTLLQERSEGRRHTAKTYNHITNTRIKTPSMQILKLLQQCTINDNSGCALWNGHFQTHQIT